VRRVGKSIFIRHLMESLRERGVPERNLVSVDMESLKFDPIRTYLDLHTYVDAQLFFRVPRYDIRGKRHLEINDKFYATDLGLRHSQIGFRDGDISGIMENLVYVELRRRGYRVSVVQWGAQEIDFVAEKIGSRLQDMETPPGMDDVFSNSCTPSN
jgi:predicted AAA+ superfamily ATPase